MKELQDIVNAYQPIAIAQRPVALATLVKVEGSTYRRLGAWMLITDQGSWVGALSGGCLEADICDRAQAVMQRNTPTLAIYDTTHDDDIIWGLGLGCQGVAHVLIEPIHHNAQLNPISLLSSCFEHRKPGGIAILIKPELANNRQIIGSLLLLYPDNTVCFSPSFSKLKDKTIENAILSDLQAVILNRKSAHETYVTAAGEIEILLQVVQPAVSLTIFGAGYDALPVATLAKQLGWYVTVVDPRSRPSSTERFKVADEVCLATPATLSLSPGTESRSAAVIMTHNYHTDLDLLRSQLFKPWSYLGILGPKSRRNRLMIELQSQGITPTTDQIEKLNSPIGLDIGAETPEEIALSILSEIQAVLTHKPGCSLKYKDTAIHTPAKSITPNYTLV